MAALPVEIKVEILRNILICPHKLAFCQLPWGASKDDKPQARDLKKRQARTIRHSKLLRLALLNCCQDNEPRAKALMASFSALCLTSKSIRIMARDIFFAHNKWVLHTTNSFDAIQWIANYWGSDALGLMKGVRIEIQGFQPMCFRALETFVGAANQGGNLKKLSVRWLGFSRPLQVARVPGRTWHFHPAARNREVERNSRGGRGAIVKRKDEISGCGSGTDSEDDIDHEGSSSNEDDTDADEDDAESHRTGINIPQPEPKPKQWGDIELMLLPLKDLRGLSHARIEGTVDENWAVWLEHCMAASKETISIPGPEFGEEALKKLDHLKNRDFSKPAE